MQKLPIFLMVFLISGILIHNSIAEFSYEIAYATYIGGSGGEDLREVMPMPDGSVIVGGQINSTDLPATAGSVQPKYAGDDPALGHPGIYGGDCYLVRLSSDGKKFLAATYFGGSKQERSVYGMGLDSMGNVVISSTTRATDIPTTAGCFQPGHAGGDSDWFVAKLTSDFRKILWCTYVGGSEGESPRGGLALDKDDNVYVVGGTASSNFPTTPGAYQRNLGGRQDSALIKLRPDGSGLAFSTLVGGSGNDPTIMGVQVDSSGNAYGAGHTQSADFPVTAGVAQPKFGGKSDCFFVKFSSDGGRLIYSTYLGGSDNEFAEHRPYLDSDGSVILAGVTASSDFPTTEGAFQRSLKGKTDGFITKLSADGKKFVFSTLLGGSGGEYWLMPLLDDAGNIFFVGQTESEDFPVTPNALQSTFGGGRNDGAFAILSPDGSKLLYATYLGGSGGDLIRNLALGADGAVYLIGNTGSKDFPVTSGAAKTEISGNGDAFVVKLVPKHR